MDFVLAQTLRCLHQSEEYTALINRINPPKNACLLTNQDYILECSNLKLNYRLANTIYFYAETARIKEKNHVISSKLYMLFNIEVMLINSSENHEPLTSMPLFDKYNIESIERYKELHVFTQCIIEADERELDWFITTSVFQMVIQEYATLLEFEQSTRFDWLAIFETSHLKSILDLAA